VQSDVTNIPHLFLRNPDWQVLYDTDPQMAAETRKKFYDMASAEKALIQGFHFPFPSAGYVEKEGAQIPARAHSLESGNLSRVFCAFELSGF
jgi:hypothetical protein